MRRPLTRRPGESRDPYARDRLDCGTRGRCLSSPRRPVVMGPGVRRDDVWRDLGAKSSSSPSLPRRDDLDLVAALQRRLAPSGSSAARRNSARSRNGCPHIRVRRAAHRRCEEAISRCSPLTVTRIASPRCRSGRARHRRASVPPAPAQAGSRGDKARSRRSRALSIVMRGRLSGKAGLRPEPNSTMRASANAGCTA